MAPPLPGSPRRAGTIAGAVALAFTGAGEAKAQSPAVQTQRPSPPSLPEQPEVAPAPAPTPAPAPAAPSATSEPAPSPAPAPAAAPPAPEPTSWENGSASDTASTTEMQWEDIETTPVLTDEGELPPASGRGGSDGGLFRPNDKRFFFRLFTGGRADFFPGYSYASLLGNMTTQVEMSIGGHGKKNPNIGGAFVLRRNFGGYYGSDLNIGARLLWDKPLSPNFAVYSSSSVTLGMRVPALTSLVGYGGYGYLGGFVQGAWGLTAVMAERISLQFRPVNFELSAPGPLFVQLSYSIMGGIGTVW